MSARRPFDSLQFAKSGESLSGGLRIEELPRLRDSLRPDDVGVQYRLSGCLAAGRPALRLEIEATVWLTCQRCMVMYPEVLILDNVMPVARNEAELARWERLDPLLDALVADPVLDVAVLVEDEILLSLPAAPLHAEGQCDPDGLALMGLS
ncbi:MAG: YceD family protein [Pseudomonadota bacterium]|nr:YceD family protein [Pseudomonadota bacterium]